MPFKRHLTAKPSIKLLMTLFHIIFLVKKKKTENKNNQNTVVWSPPLAHPKEGTEEESRKDPAFAQDG